MSTISSHRAQSAEEHHPGSSASVPQSRDAKAHGPGSSIYLAFIPWVLFTLITQHDTLLAAALAALAASVIVAVPSVRRGRPKLLEVGAVLAFAAFTVVGLVADHSTAHWVARYARAIAAATLALIAFGSLLVTPFTEQYARDSVPREFWSTAKFKNVNRRLTLTWAYVFTAMVPSHLIAGALDTRRANTIFNWVVPIILIVWAANRTAAVSAAETTTPEGPR